MTIELTKEVIRKTEIDASKILKKSNRRGTKINKYRKIQ